MPNCPRCLKHFASRRGVTSHLSQPRSACHDNNYTQQLVVPRVRVEDYSGSPPILPDSLPDLPDPRPEDDLLAAPPDSADNEADVPMGEVPPSRSPEPEHPDSRKFVAEYFEGASAIYGTGETFVSRFNQDTYANRRRSNAYYPFADSNDWMVGDFLSKSKLSMASIDEYLSMPATKNLRLSFHTARDLRARVESLPPGPRWNYHIVSAEHETKESVVLYYRDALDCIKLLFNNPFFADKLEYVPYRLFTQDNTRVYTEWMSSDGAWEFQTKIPLGGTLCGVILSSDKTNITNICGGRVAHPLLISLANIKMDVRNKASAHAFLLLALLPIPEFIHDSSRMRSVLEARLFHRCLDIVLQPLKEAMRYGITIPDPCGDLRYCFMPLVSYIVDTPEACLIACVRGKTSPVTTASHETFGDPFRHPPRTAALTKSQLESIAHLAADVETYFGACAQFRLSGVDLPFWRDWPLASPSHFLTPEPLHYWHRASWDHDVSWCRVALGDDEIDFRFSVLPKITGLQHFNKGITNLKQVGGRTQRDVQRYLVAVIAGAANPNVITAVRALMDFRYLSQSPAITTKTRDRIVAALDEFHTHKQAILNAGLRRGKKSAIDHFRIPKLELMHSVAPSVAQVGSLLQWSADTTEHAHIEVVKDPASMTNHRDYNSQICRTLDRDEKRRLFATAIRLLTPATAPMGDNVSLDEDDDDKDARVGDNASENALDDLWSARYRSSNFFKIALQEASAPTPEKTFPTRTIIAGPTAIHLNIEPNHRRLSVDQVAEAFQLPDLRGALADYVRRDVKPSLKTFHTWNGARRSRPDAELPFSELQIWHKVRLQQKSYHIPETTAQTFTINAHPPDRTWKFGRHDAAVLQLDQSQHWPYSGLTGHCVVLVRLIMCPAVPRRSQSQWASRALIYAERLDAVPQQTGKTEPTTDLYVLKRANRASGDRLGEVFPLSQLRSYAHIVPRFGRKANNRLTYSNSIHGSQYFLLNKYFDKDFFYAISDVLP